MSDISTNVKRVFSRGSHFVPPAPAPAPAPAPETNINFSISEVYDGDNENEPQVEFNPLDALNRDNYKPPEPEEKKPRGRPPKKQSNVIDDKILEMARRKQEQMMMKARPIAPIPSYHHNDGEEMSSDDLMSKEIRGLHLKVMQYKTMFPENKQIQALKIPKHATKEDLEMVIMNMDNLLDCSSCSLDNFIIHSCLQLLEVGESFFDDDSEYNLKGLSSALAKNKEFMLAAKQIYVKYTSVYAMSCEMRLMYSILLTASSVVAQNAAKRATAGKTVDKHVLDELNDV